MDYYRELLDTVFRTLCNTADPTVLSLVPDGVPDEEDDRRRVASFELPATFQPNDADIRMLPHGEPFVDASLEIARSSRADCIFAFPPLAGSMRQTPEFRDRFGSLGLIEAAVGSLVDDPQVSASVFAFLAPSQFLATMRCGKWRQQFFPDHSALVIEHGQDMSELVAAPASIKIPFCSVVFTRMPGPVRFFRIPDTSLSEAVQRLQSDLQRLIRQPAGQSQFGYVYQGSLAERYPTSYDFYSEQTERLRQEVGELGERVQLGQVAEILVGFLPCNPERDAGQGITGFLSISARDITMDGRVELSEVKEHEQPARVQHYLQQGDLCIRQVYPADGGFIVGVYEGDSRRITWSPNVIVVRPKPELLPAQRQVLLSFLRSPLAQRLGSAKQRMSSLQRHLRVTPRVLQDFPVPIADRDIMAAIEHLSEARGAFQTWIAEIDDASNAIVRESTASGSRNRILQSGQLARQRYRAATQVEELDYRIRTQFPHPLAYVWRELQVSGPDLYHRLRAVTKAAEGHACFLAQLGILLGRITGKPIAYLNSMAARLKDRPGGTNFGDWFAIVREVNEARAFRDLDANAPLAELRSLCAEELWEPAIRKLMALRNDDSHGRIAPTSVSADLVAEAEASLETVYRTTEFLTDYRLVLITETRFDSIRRINRFQYRDLSGDNALAPLRSAESNRNDLESGSLYLRDRQDGWWLLRPMLNYLECPECHQMSTFFLDTYDSSSPATVEIKSFERNSVRRERFADDFRHIGLLK